ncbi:pyrroline-5-carboxylate reductase [Natronospora cellulosivora (SeqCode)]
MKLGIIGLGKMGTSLLKGIVKKEIYLPNDIIGSDLNADIRESNENYFFIRTCKKNTEVVKKSDIIILAVKPQVMANVLKEIAPYSEKKIIISIAAGIDIEKIKNHLAETCRVVRVMPNTPAMVNQAVSAVAVDPNFKSDNESQNILSKDLEKVDEILASVGEVVHVEENMMDAVTGLSGSGPAYIYLLIEALSDGGVLMGLSRDISMKLAAQTVLGAASMVMETGKHPGELKDMVTSPAGTTIKAIESLEQNGFRSSIISAVKASAERSKELNES